LKGAFLFHIVFIQGAKSYLQRIEGTVWKLLNKFRNFHKKST